MPYRLRSVGLLAKACIRLSQYSCPRQKTIQQRPQSLTSPSVALKDRLHSNPENAMVSVFQKCGRTGTGVEDITPDFHSLHDLPMIYASNDAELTRNTGRNWLQLENNLDENEIQKRKYEPNTVSLQRWVWDLWCRFCGETNRDPLQLMKEDPPNIRTLWTFFDYTVTNRRQYINAASTLQTYWNVWTLLRREKVGLSIPGFIKDKMTGVRDQLTAKHGLRTERKQKPILRSEDVFQLMKVLWTTGSETWDPVQLALIVLLAGMTGHRPDALLHVRHADVAVTLFPTGRERPHMVLEVKPNRTKRYRGRKKQNPTLGIPEVPSEPCLLLCPKTLLLALLLRKSAFLHLHIVSAEKLYALQVPPDAGSLSLCPREPEALLFDISARTLNAWLKRLGELAGFDLPITSYWLRRGAGEALNSSCEISEAQQNLLLQHASGSVYQDRYAPDYFPKDFSAVWRGRQPQSDIIRIASGQGRSINLRRPIDLNEAQEAEADSQPDVQRCKAQWQHAKQKVQMMYGTVSKGKGTPLFEDAMKKRNTYHTARQAARRVMKEAIREKFNKEQPMADIIRQVHGLPLDSGDRRDAGPVPPEQYRAFSMLFRFAPTTEREETECRAAAVDAVAKVGPSRRHRLRIIHSQTAVPEWVTAALQGKRHIHLARRQCLFCLALGIREEPFSRDSSFERHIRRVHDARTRCPDPACRGMLIGHVDVANHMRYVHGA